MAVNWEPTVSLHLRIRVVPGRRNSLLKFLNAAKPFYESPGGIHVRLLADESDPDRFVEIVEYADEQTYRLDDQRVKRDPDMAAYIAQWHELLAEPPVVEVFREANLHWSAG